MNAGNDNGNAGPASGADRPSGSPRGPITDSLKKPLPKRFYKNATCSDAAPFQALLDGRQIKTPKKRPLVLPTRALAEAIAGGIFLARDLRPVPEGERYVRGEEEADMVLQWVPLDDALVAVHAGRLQSPTAVVGILAAVAARAAGWSHAS